MADLSGVSTTGLELYLPFDDNYDDDSGNNRDQTPAIGSESYATDGPGGTVSAAKFSPTLKNYVDTGVEGYGDAELFAGPGVAWTIATWIRFEGESSAGSGPIASRWAPQKRTPGNILSRIFWLTTNIDRSEIELVLRGAPTNYEFNMQDGEHHHVAVTWDGTTAKVYLDNTAQSNANVGNLADYPIDLFIAAAGPSIDGGVSPQILSGQLADWRLYSRALTAGEINLLWAYRGGTDSGSGSVVPQDLELLLEFEDDLTDGSVNGRHQTANLQNGPLTFVDGRVGNKAARFEADDEQYIDTGVQAFGDADFFSDTGHAWSVFFWAKDPGGTGDFGGVVISKAADSGADMFRIQLTNGGANIRLRGQLSNYTLTGNNDGGWHSYALTWNGTAAAFYYDDVAQTVPTNGSDAEGSQNILIGAGDTLGGGAGISLFYDAEIDDLRIYSDALTEGEMDDIIGDVPATFTAALEMISLTGAAASIRATFGRAPLVFVSGGITVTNGTVSNLTEVSDTVFTFTVTATADGLVTVQVPAAAVTDEDAVQTNSASNTLSYTVGGAVTGSDGIVRFDRAVARTHTATVIIGPIMISPNLLEQALLGMTRVVFGNGTTATGTVNIAGGVDGEDAIHRIVDDVPQFSTTIASLQANGGTCYPNVRGHAMAFEIDVTTGPLQFEQAATLLRPGGMNRGIRRP